VIEQKNLQVGESMLSKFKALVLAAVMIASAGATASAQQPDLSFVSPDGQTISLSSLRGKVVILLFGGVQDPQCKDEFRALQSLAERYQDKGVNIYWVSINPVADASNDKLKNPCGPAGSVIILRDQNMAGFKRYSGRQLPTIVVLNQQGDIHGQPRGGFNPNSDFVNDLAAVIDSLLNQK
jgi:thiol-disulfide isomerase/thioredoxin